MKRNLLALLLMISAVVLPVLRTSAQCPNGTLQSLFAFECDTNTAQTINTGDYYSFEVISGVTYNFNDGSTSFDSQIFGKQGGTGGTLVFQEDNAGSSGVESLDWTASFTGTLYVAVHHYNCIWQGTSAVLGFKQISDSTTNTTDSSAVNLCTNNNKLLEASIAGGSWSVVNGGGTIVDSVYNIINTGTNTIRYSLDACDYDVDFEVYNSRQTISVTDTPSGSLTLSASFGSISWYQYTDSTDLALVDTGVNFVPVKCDTFMFAMVTDSQWCVSYSDTFFKDCPSTSIEMLDDNWVRVYPNPSSDRIFVHASSDALNLSVYSIDGVEIKTIRLEADERAVIDNLLPGTYVFVMQNDKWHTTRRVMILGE